MNSLLSLYQARDELRRGASCRAQRISVSCVSETQISEGVPHVTILRVCVPSISSAQFSRSVVSDS